MNAFLSGYTSFIKNFADSLAKKSDREIEMQPLSSPSSLDRFQLPDQMNKISTPSIESQRVQHEESLDETHGKKF
jgi:hypothetical protein